MNDAASASSGRSTGTRGPQAAEAEAGAGEAADVRVDVFLSYNSKDHAEVLGLAEGLSKAGFEAFLDRWDLEPGLRWRPELERVIGSCGAVLVMVGPHGLGEVQEREVDVALRRQDRDRRFPVVPVLLPGAEPPGGFLEPLTWVDLRHLSPELSLERLVAVLRKRQGRGTTAEPSRASRRRYLGNLFLLFGILVVMTAWYLRHLETLSTVAFGGSLGLPLMLWLTVLYVRWGAEDEIKNLPRRLLGSRGSSWSLWGGLGVAVGLWVATSSIQVATTAGTAGGESWRVEVRSAAGDSLWRTPALEGDRRVATRLFFFRWGTTGEVVLEPAGDRGPIRVRLGPAKRLRVSVPADFRPRPVDVVRVLPGRGLVQVLGKPGASVIRKYDLAITAGGAVVRVPDLRRQAVYLGGAASDIATGWGRETEAERKAWFAEWADQRLGLPAAASRDVVAMWMESRRHEGWEPPAGLGEVVFELQAEGATVPERLVPTILGGTNGIRTVLIDRAPRTGGDP